MSSKRAKSAMMFPHTKLQGENTIKMILHFEVNFFAACLSIRYKSCLITWCVQVRGWQGMFPVDCHAEGDARRA